MIDEADEMLDQDWEAELNKIMAGGGMCERTVCALFLLTFLKTPTKMLIISI